MNEWTVVVVIGALVALFLSVGAPIIRLNSTLSTFCTKVDHLDEDLGELTTRNSKSHERLWDHNEKQDRIITDHTKILTEHDMRIKNLGGKK